MGNLIYSKHCHENYNSIINCLERERVVYITENLLGKCNWIHLSS